MMTGGPPGRGRSGDRAGVARRFPLCSQRSGARPVPIRSPPLCCVRSWIRDIPRQPFGTIHRVICQLVRTAILLARHPDVRDGTESTRGLVREPGERFQVGVLDLPATRHLLDHEFGIHPYFGRRAGRDERSRLQPGDQPAILGHVVGRVADSLRDLGKHLAGFGIHYDGPVSGVAWIAARTAVRLYEQPSDPMTRRQLLPRPSHSPDSGVRTRMRRHSSQRITSSGSAARMWFRSTVLRARWHPSQRPRRSAAAPTPPCCWRSFR